MNSEPVKEGKGAASSSNPLAGIPTFTHFYVRDNGELINGMDECLMLEFKGSESPALRLRNKFRCRNLEDFERVMDFIKALGFDRL